jgi:hypothetical protein
LKDEQKRDDNKPKSSNGFDYVLSGLVLFTAAVCGSITGDHAADNKENPTNYEIARWTRVVGLWTRGLVIVGVITAGVLGAQTCTLINQLAEMKAEQRPWLQIGTSAVTPLTYDDKGNVHLMLQTAVKNIGHFPAQYVYTRGQLFPMVPQINPIKRRDILCETLRNRELTAANVGFVMMPGDVKNPFLPLTMAADDFELWKKVDGSVPLIAGCVDYVFVTDMSHHHLGFILEVDKRGSTPETPFASVRPSDGTIPQGNLLLDENPTLPWDID